MTTAEHFRLEAVVKQSTLWKLWGSYLSESRRGVLREDHTDGVATWNSFVRDQAHSRIDRWGEDGQAGRAPLRGPLAGTSSGRREAIELRCKRGNGEWAACRDGQRGSEVIYL